MSGSPRGVLACLVLALASGCTAQVPPLPLTATTLVDGEVGSQGYVGVGAPYPIAVDGGWRRQFLPNLAMDVTGAAVFAFNGGQFGVSPGVWATVPIPGERAHHGERVACGSRTCLSFPFEVLIVPDGAWQLTEGITVRAWPEEVCSDTLELLEVRAWTAAEAADTSAHTGAMETDSDAVDTDTSMPP